MLTTLKDCTNSILIKGLVSPQNLKYLDKEGGKPEILGFNEHGKGYQFSRIELGGGRKGGMTCRQP
jgi:hypothetical protein